MSEFEQCPNGHYYQGDHCPYCPSPKVHEKKVLYRVLKACHNLHAYDAEFNICSICGSSIVIDKFSRKSTDTTLVMSIRLTNPVHVQVGELELSECNYIQVALPHGYKQGYFFTATQNYWNNEALEIEPDKKIVFGTLTMTGKEFIRLCDLIYDNKLSVKNYSYVDVNPDDLIQLQELLKRVTRDPMKTPNADPLEYGHNVFKNPTIGDDGMPIFSVKVCPNGHGYDANQMSCPFCGSDVVSEVIEQRGGFTLVIADLSYERDGISTLCKHAEVDGEMLSGDLCMRIEYTGSFKYAYYVSQKEGRGGLVVNPQSHIVLSGGGFSDTFTGCKFYKMCDELFDKQERIRQRVQDDTLINKEVENTCSEPELQKDILVKLKKSLEYRQCINGHYYQGDYCPYCNGKKVVKIGRSIDNDYIVDNPQVSEHHCQIEYLGNSQYGIVDLGSATGTFVNGNRVEGSCPLKYFDEVSIGGASIPWMHHFASTEPEDTIMTGLVEPPDVWKE